MGKGKGALRLIDHLWFILLQRADQQIGRKGKPLTTIPVCRKRGAPVVLMQIVEHDLIGVCYNRWRIGVLDIDARAGKDDQMTADNRPCVLELGMLHRTAEAPDLQQGSSKE